jgi:hypothetical protein
LQKDKLDKSDLALLQPYKEPVKAAKKAPPPIASWLRRTEYISSDLATKVQKPRMDPAMARFVLTTC